eukprot:GHVN01003092.1.p1 GENE.GHVN01003092.1~~GHVN01003092.1.p1  ORF type:complete len:202 (+),score=32.03 GHVN01003092.1:824-1429(+)
MTSAVRTPFHRACTWGSLTDFETRSVGSDFEVDNLNADHAKATLLDLAEELRVTRRENVDKHILPSAQQWEEVLSRHLKVREEMLAETRRIYRQKYNPLTRRLSLESGCRKYYSDHVKPLKNQIALGRKLLALVSEVKEMSRSVRGKGADVPHLSLSFLSSLTLTRLMIFVSKLLPRLSEWRSVMQWEVAVWECTTHTAVR